MVHVIGVGRSNTSLYILTIRIGSCDICWQINDTNFISFILRSGSCDICQQIKIFVRPIKNPQYWSQLAQCQSIVAFYTVLRALDDMHTATAEISFSASTRCLCVCLFCRLVDMLCCFNVQICMLVQLI